MRNKIKGVLVLISALGLWGCADKLADDGLGANSSAEQQSSVYMNVAVLLPTASATRSATDNGTDVEEGTDPEGETNSNADPDFEYGYADENDVRSMLLVLADAENDNYITHAVVSGITQSPRDPVDSRFNFQVSQKFSREEINAAYESEDLLKNNKNVHVYAFCNYTGDLYDKFENYAKEGKHDNKWLDWQGEVVEGGSLPGQSPTITNSIWSGRSFLMSNARVRTAKFPETPADWDKHTQETNPFNLTPAEAIYVERAAARIDYKDGSKYAGSEEEYGAEYKDYRYRYDLETKGNDATTGAEQTYNLISVQLTRMALVNMSKNYYYLRRVSSDGQGKTEGKDNKFQVGGIETMATGSTPYVVDTDWQKKGQPYGINTFNATDHFNFSLFKTTTEADAENKNVKKQYNFTGWFADNIEEVLDGREDTWTENAEGAKKGSYKIWRYVTENTIPSPVENQKTVQSVGVVFKAAIVPGADVDQRTGNYPYVSEEVQKALDAAKEHKTPEEYTYPVLYSHNNILYAGVDELVAGAVTEGIQGYLYGVMNKILGHWCLDGTEFKYQETIPENATKLTVEIWDAIKNHKEHDGVDPIYADQNSKFAINLIETGNGSEAFKKLITDEKITIYEVSNEEMGTGGQGWGYYCYYFYWNRHNDNGNNSIMHTMEFSTVRNNVYKLSVTKIGELGHPSIPENDPDPVDPEDPDEEDKVYMDVKVEVLPWVVRVNDITF